MINDFTANRVDDVIDAYEHALHARYPMARYAIGRHAKFVHIPLS
jgi:predicted class III extradiol MEMO1 family dioxygenase